jgi:hypothetical protein
VIPLLVFLGATALDYVSTMMALDRGLTEGGPLTRKNPLLFSLISTVVLVVAAEIYRIQGAANWSWVYYIGGSLHGLAAIWNIVQIARRR